MQTITSNLDTAAQSFMVQMFKSTGPRALFSWFDGRMNQKSAMEILLLTFHTSAALGSMAACFGALYIYMFEFQPRCPRLMSFILVTGIVWAIYLAFNFLSVISSNNTLAVVNLVCCVAGVHLFFNIFNVFASVWVFSERGKYYSENGCSLDVVRMTRAYLIVWWAYTFVLCISVCLTTFAIFQAYQPHKKHDQPNVPADAPERVALIASSE